MADRERVQQAIQSIYDDYGFVTPTLVLEAATESGSPLHECFEWNSKKAAHEYRLFQARQLIRRVKIIVEDREEELVHVPVIENEDGYREGEYKPLRAVVESQDELDRCKAVAIKRLLAARQMVVKIKQAAKGNRKVQSQINSALKSIASASSNVRKVKRA